MEPTTSELVLAGLVLFFAGWGVFCLIVNLFTFGWFLCSIRNDRKVKRIYLKLEGEEITSVIDAIEYTLERRNGYTDAVQHLRGIKKKLKEERDEL